MSIARTPASDEIDAIIATALDWRGATLARLRTVIISADPAISEEVKWRKPSRPEGVATWVADGNICIADLLKNAVRLTFPKGARVDDPAQVFNTRLDSATVRAVDVFEGSSIDESALLLVVRSAIAVNRAG